MQKKIEQLNQKFIKDGQKDISLNPAELATLSSLRKHLETTGATATSQAVAGGLDLTVKLVTAWPYGDRMPGLDLLRLLAIAPKTATFSHPRVGNIVDILEGSVCETTPPAENHVMMAVRAFVNLFESEEGRKLALADFDKINSLTSQAILRGTSNRNLLIAAVTLYINYAVMLQSSPETFEQGLALLEVLSKILSSQTDSEVVYRALIATGTLLGLNEELKTAAKEVYGIEGAISTAVSKAADPRVKNVAAEVRALLI
jgi:phospholipase A-2-activating protein